MSTVKKKQRGNVNIAGNVAGPVPSYEENIINNSKNETTKLRCFMGSTVTLFLLTFLFQLLTFGFIVSIWLNTNGDGGDD